MQWNPGHEAKDKHRLQINENRFATSVEDKRNYIRNELKIFELNNKIEINGYSTSPE